MSKASWLQAQLESARREVAGWDDWRRDVMRREVSPARAETVAREPRQSRDSLTSRGDATVRKAR